MLVCYPLGRQHVAELVHSLYTAHADVHSVGLYTTAGLTTSFVSSCLLYLVRGGSAVVLPVPQHQLQPIRRWT